MLVRSKVSVKLTGIRVVPRIVSVPHFMGDGFLYGERLPFL